MYPKQRPFGALGILCNRNRRLCALEAVRNSYATQTTERRRGFYVTKNLVLSDLQYSILNTDLQNINTPFCRPIPTISHLASKN